jgi:hypothetical protein
MHYEYWPECVIELNKELASGLHEELEKQLRGVDDFIERFATICAYCEIALDGMYTSDQMLAMIEALVLPRLVKKRINPNKPIIVNS